MNKLIQYMIDTGHTVTVTHGRLTEYQVKILLEGVHRVPLETYSFLSYDKIKKQDRAISGKGGKTTVKVFDAGTGDLMVEAVAYCNPTDNFSKKRGTMIAAGRALKELEG